MTPLNAPNTELLIKDYFLAAPADRPAQRKSVASHITTVDNVILVLDWGAYSTSAVNEAYESAFDLLIRCGKLLIETPDSPRLNQWRWTVHFEKMLQLLMTGISFLPKIHPNDKLEAIIKILPLFGSRYCDSEIKLNVVKALLNLAYEVELDELKNHVYNFLSANFRLFKYDEPIRQYAQNIFDEVYSNLAAMKKHEEKQIRLKELVEKITPDNQHGETDWGNAVGQEIWWSGEDDVILI